MNRHPASEIHVRARRNARAAIPAALERIRAAGLDVGHEDGSEQVTVAGRFYLMPSLGFWREIKGRRQGYDVAQLIAAAKEPLPPVTAMAEPSL
jgi:hypothetical protein